MSWRLLMDGEHTAAWNMAMDQAILEAVDASIAPATLRIYRWMHAAVTVGRFQDVDRDIDTEYCASHGIPIVRRPTGGRGILHGADLTVSLAAPMSFFGDGPIAVSAIYARVAEGFVAATKDLGLPVRRATCERSEQRSGDCFQVRSRADLVAPDNSKLIGCAMRRLRDSVLLQSSIRYGRPEHAAENVFRSAGGPEYYPFEHIASDDMAESIVRGFRSALAINLIVGHVSGWEEERAAALVKSVQVADNSTDELHKTDVR